VLGLNQTQPVVKQAIEACGVSLPPVTSASVDEYAAACEQYAHTVEGTHAYRAFVALWILCASRTLDGVDLLIDMDRLGQSSPYVSELHALFRTQTNATPDIGGARDLVEEAKRGSERMMGIDGRLLRAIHFSAQKFLLSQVDSSCDSQTRIANVIKAKLALADEISGQWRY
jgi:hypothetical protein